MRLRLKLSRSIKKSTKFVAIFAIAIIAGHGMSSQLAAQVPSEPSQPLTSLKTVPIPGPSPSELAVYVKDKKTAIMLGKSLFWDMQVGSDGIQACASCHFNAGADNRIKNQISPGLLRVNQDRSPNADTTFQTGRPNYTLQSKDFPFHKLADPNNRNSEVISDSNDVASSQGVFNTQFVDVIRGSAQDKVSFTPDPVFNVAGTETRRVEPRNTPTTINAVFNFRNFWDGRAQNEFNGVNPFGKRDPNARVLKAATATSPLQEVRVSLKIHLWLRRQ
jgi:cytochrome c peroxidase